MKKVCADGEGSKLVVYSIFVFAYSQSERTDEACVMYDEMVKNGCWPGISLQAELE